MINVVKFGMANSKSYDKIKTHWILKRSRFGISIGSVSINSDRKFFEVKSYLYGVIKIHQLKYMPLEFKSINEVCKLLLKCKKASFKGSSKPKTVRVYIDNKTYLTKASGLLKVKNGVYYTTNGLIKKYLIDHGVKLQNQ